MDLTLPAPAGVVNQPPVDLVDENWLTDNRHSGRRTSKTVPTGSPLAQGLASPNSELEYRLLPQAQEAHLSFRLWRRAQKRTANQGIDIHTSGGRAAARLEYMNYLNAGLAPSDSDSDSSYRERYPAQMANVIQVEEEAKQIARRCYQDEMDQGQNALSIKTDIDDSDYTWKSHEAPSGLRGFVLPVQQEQTETVSNEIHTKPGPNNSERTLESADVENGPESSDAGAGQLQPADDGALSTEADGMMQDAIPVIGTDQTPLWSASPSRDDSPVRQPSKETLFVLNLTPPDDHIDSAPQEGDRMMGVCVNDGLSDDDTLSYVPTVISDEEESKAQTYHIETDGRGDVTITRLDEDGGLTATKSNSEVERDEVQSDPCQSTSDGQGATPRPISHQVDITTDRRTRRGWSPVIKHKGEVCIYCTTRKQFKTRQKTDNVKRKPTTQLGPERTENTKDDEDRSRQETIIAQKLHELGVRSVDPHQLYVNAQELARLMSPVQPTRDPSRLMPVLGAITPDDSESQIGNTGELPFLNVLDDLGITTRLPMVKPVTDRPVLSTDSGLMGDPPEVIPQITSGISSLIRYRHLEYMTSYEEESPLPDLKSTMMRPRTSVLTTSPYHSLDSLVPIQSARLPVSWMPGQRQMVGPDTPVPFTDLEASRLEELARFNINVLSMQERVVLALQTELSENGEMFPQPRAAKRRRLMDALTRTHIDASVSAVDTWHDCLMLRRRMLAGQGLLNAKQQHAVMTASPFQRGNKLNNLYWKNVPTPCFTKFRH